MQRGIRPILIATLSGLAFGGLSSAQDSVATAPGQSDAISAFDLDLQRVRYVVDLSPVVSGWGTAFGVAPVLKATRSIATGFSTQILGGAGLSAGHRTNVEIPSTPFSLWTAPGQGVNPAFNGGPGSSVTKTTFGRAFGVAFSDFGLETADQTLASSAVGAIVGQDSANPARLFVERTTALVSRNDVMEPDSSSISMGSVDEGGNVYLRVDDFGATLGFASVKGENVLAVSLAERDVTPGSVGALNFLINLSGSPTGLNQTLSGATATRFLINNGTTTLNTPIGVYTPILPSRPELSHATLALDFRGRVTLGRDTSSAATSTTSHLASGVGGLRGNPTFSIAKDLAGTPTAGVVAALAIPTGSTRATMINAFGLTTSSNPATAPSITPGSATSAALPSPINGPAGFVGNATGQAEFTHYLSQVSFRGPSGQVGVGRTNAGELVLAAVATDPGAPAGAREFLAIATRNPTSGAFTWTVAAHPGMAVLNGPPSSGSATQIGALATQSPASISTPAVDLLGNVYFVAAWDDARPTGSPGPGGESGPGRKTGLFRAVRADTGEYALELLLCSGQTVLGANSQTPWTIARLTLADADSVASGGFHGGQVLQAQIPGRETTNSRSSFAAGGVIVNATIRYDRGAQSDSYEAVLFLGPRNALTGDANGDGIVNFADLNLVLANFGFSGTPGSLSGDLNGDGVVNFADLNLVLSSFGATGS
jgi:hypothetical protein